MSSSSEAVIKWRTLTKKRIIQSMGGCCSSCGYNKSDAALELHHLDASKKDFGLGSVRAHPTSWGRICAELRKCVMVCANCHREIHDGTRSIASDAPQFNETFADYKSVERSMRIGTCPVCKGPKRISAVTCSTKCSAQKRNRGNWAGHNLEEMKKTMTYAEIGAIIGVSDVSVHKRMKRLRLL